MAIPKRERDGLYTYGDYKQWSDEERWELIHGVAYSMTPAPARLHQEILTGFTLFFSQYFEGDRCSVYYAPFDVVLPESKPGDEVSTEDHADTVVQPDVSVICDESKLTDQGCTGAPDFVVEILSPSTAFKDMDEKCRLYEHHGVREYWIVNPANETVMVYVQDVGGRGGGTTTHRFAKPVLYSRDDSISSACFPDLTVELARVFPEKRTSM